MIAYTYDYHRLTGISYSDHPENNVKYYYGGRNASHNRIGRLMMREDRTGAIEYFYDKMGEVTKKVYKDLTDIQLGRAEDRFGWLYRLA